MNQKHQSSLILTGVTGLQNRGVEALVTALLAGIRACEIDGEITVLTSTPEYDSNQLSSSANVRENSLHFSVASRSAHLRRFINTLLGRSDSVRETADLIKGSRHVIATGGDVFSSDYGSMAAHLNPLNIAQKNGVPYTFLAHSIGPFRTQYESELWSRFARGAALITTREHLSFEYVTKNLGIPEDKVAHTADVAFLLQTPSAEELDRLWQQYDLKSEPFVAVVPSRGFSRFANLKPSEHMDSWVRTVAYIRNQLGMRVLLVPHVQGPSVGNDDRIMATEILRRFSWDRGLTLAGADHTASEYKGLISGCGLVITERMHAAIAAMDTMVPLLVVGYSVKARGILEDTLGSEASHALVSADEFLTPGVVEQRLPEVLSRGPQTKEILARSLPEVRRRARRNFELLKAKL